MVKEANKKFEEEEEYFQVAKRLAAHKDLRLSWNVRPAPPQTSLDPSSNEESPFMLAEDNDDVQKSRSIILSRPPTLPFSPLYRDM